MTNPDWNLQVKTGRGRSDVLVADASAHHRAINVAQQLLTAGKWPDHLNTLIVIHHAYDAHRQLQLSGPGEYHAEYNVTVYPAVHDLIHDRDYEIHSMTISFRQTHNLYPLPPSREQLNESTQNANQDAAHYHIGRQVLPFLPGGH